MEQAQRHQLAFVLALVGGIIGIAMGAMMGLMMSFFTAFGSGFRGNAGEEFPLGLMTALFGWLALAAVAGGVIMIASSFSLRQPGAASRTAATWCIVGGAITIFGGNMLAAGLGIAAGVIILSAPQEASA